MNIEIMMDQQIISINVLYACYKLIEMICCILFNAIDTLCGIRIYFLSEFL